MERQLRWGGVGAEQADKAGQNRAEYILGALNGFRESAGHKYHVGAQVQIGGSSSAAAANALATQREAEEAEHAKRKAAKRADAAQRWALEEAELKKRAAEEAEEARRRAEDPEYAAKRMAEEEAAVMRRMAEEKRELEAKIQAAEARAVDEETLRKKQQKAAKASLDLLEKEREILAKKKVVQPDSENSAVSAYEQAKQALARKEKETDRKSNV
eukprot:TRINITY_DN40572_c0_g1_i1.p1 TRINITY_DN40572_c0_g1~~TRINITY_DN40572_c0_g1_i1.p1  ORF type:complete len:229 (+),score=85.26 TRINITY_DN40572_c0_g1_i1:45-689(+)